VTRRRSRQTGSLPEVVDQLPDRFFSIDFVVDAEMTGLRAYMADLGQHLSWELGYPVDQGVVPRVMAELGIAPAEWYRLGFRQEEQGRG
jgi:hypothetical protein